MENDLFSRRQFFKKSLKKILPVIGGVVLGALHLEKAEGKTPTNCIYGCAYACMTSCSGACDFTCLGDCHAGCKTSCYLGCKTMCTETCRGGCKNGCADTCYNSCSGGNKY